MSDSPRCAPDRYPVADRLAPYRPEGLAPPPGARTQKEYSHDYG
nr:MAG TPA: hypothetical protein [Caudoviricetes sp.]DAS73359.1 MAG TPA: hypothetical protein [Caudoviricetes sp.]